MKLLALNAEDRRLKDDSDRLKNWKRWGPYLSERQWGTVREDYSENGDAWKYFPHDQAAQRVYRWGEDGLLGFTDRQCRLCFGLALWNTRDPILKERLFGLTGPEGNHGEDVKECYFYLDSTPTHSYCRALYKYPQAEFPYRQLVEENQRRSKQDSEFELVDTGIFDQNRYFDVVAEYAKENPNDILVRISITNHGPDAAAIHVLPTFWFRNTWIWGCRHEGCTLKPRIQKSNDLHAACEHENLGRFDIAFDEASDTTTPELLFTENETNTKSLFGTEQYTTFVKDAFHRYVIDDEKDAINPRWMGTKVAAHYPLTISAGKTVVLRARWYSVDEKPKQEFGPSFANTFQNRKNETDEFYESKIPDAASDEQKQISRQAYAGLLWSKQFYHFIVKDWLHGDEDVSAPSPERRKGRNREWLHLYARDVISMPDKWEYPWFAAWDLAFHMVPMARIDASFAKRQLLLLLREWYMHPNGQIPAYEYGFEDVNPPVHAWACLRVYQITAENGTPDRTFLAKAFQRLLLNFTWWVNRADTTGENVFAGGFLGLDNIGIFDRSKPLPTGGALEQADGTAWMAFYCAAMLSIALELARDDLAYEEMASKFLDHFVRITDAINTLEGRGLWDDEDGLYYDHLRLDGKKIPLKVRSLVSLLPLIAVQVLDKELINRLPEFKGRLTWFMTYRHDLAKHISFCTSHQNDQKFLLAIPTKDHLTRVLECFLDEAEFLSEFGIRSLSKKHSHQPYQFDWSGQTHEVAYLPGESDSYMFGGNSNWRGPIWFPVNFLLIEAIEKYFEFFGEDFKIEFPTGSGNLLNLKQVAEQLTWRLTKIFARDETDRRPCFGDDDRWNTPHWDHLIWFHEFFHGDSGKGFGASHQTGWTALVAECIDKLSRGEAASLVAKAQIAVN